MTARPLTWGGTAQLRADPSSSPGGAELIGIGARAPLGLSALQVAMGARARKRLPRGTPFRDKRAAEIGACVCDDLDSALHGYDRLVALAAPALREALVGVGNVEIDAAPAPLVIAAPEPGRPDDDPRLSQAIATDIARHAGISIDEGRSSVVRAGHAGFAFALRWAMELSRSSPLVIVGAVDSYFHPDVLRWLDDGCRLHSLEAENGIVPSEGAAFAVLSRTRSPVAAVIHCETGEEPSVLSGEPNVAATMTRLVHRAIEAAPGGRISWVLSDLNGEDHRTHEWSLVAIRARLREDCQEWRPADDLGDVGAASGALYLTLAATLFAAGCAPGPSALIALHAEGAERGVFVLEERR